MWMNGKTHLASPTCDEGTLCHRPLVDVKYVSSFQAEKADCKQCLKRLEAAMSLCKSGIQKVRGQHLPL